MRGLDERGRDSRGLSVDAEGIRLGPRGVLVRRTRDGYRCAGRTEIGALVEAVGGAESDADAVFAALCRIARALGDGEIAFAQIMGLHSPLAAFDDAELRRVAGIADLIKANFNPDEPRVPAGSPEGGQWTSDGGTGVPAHHAEDGGGERGLHTHLIEAGYTLSSETWRAVRDLYRLFMAPGSDMAALRDYLAERGLRFDELSDVIRSLFDAPKPLKELQTTCISWPTAPRL